MQVKIINESGFPAPSYATSGSAGMDIRAKLEQDLEIAPMATAMVPTGLSIEIPLGYEAQLRPRSGMAIKRGLTLPNSPATIDSDYRGEIRIGIINLSNQNQIIQNGDRVAQMIIAKHEVVEWNEVEVLSTTVRGEGGFGHTGNQ